MFNEETARGYEKGAIIARRYLSPTGVSVNPGFDVANYLQELADRLRKEDHDLSALELSELILSYKAMLVFE
jgi:hypothetical protein